MGYCVSTISAVGTGEIDSLYVSEQFRGQGIGTTLVAEAMAWMDGCGVTTKIVVVAGGNEQACAFYERWGFFVRSTKLEQNPKGEGTPMSELGQRMSDGTKEPDGTSVSEWIGASHGIGASTAKSLCQDPAACLLKASGRESMMSVAIRLTWPIRWAARSPARP